jgi:hypothetical protein
MMRVIAAALLLWAILPNPYVYYIVLRFIVCGVCSSTAFVYVHRACYAHAILFCGLALLFNPVVPVYLDRQLWMFVDGIAAVLLLRSFIRDRRKMAYGN